MAWMLGGALASDRVDLAPVDGAAVAVRPVSADDQERWRAKRQRRKMGWGALGDEGDAHARSYPYIAVPEWILDSCTACVEVGRSADFAPPGTLDLGPPAHEATKAGQLRFLSEAVADVIRLTGPDDPIQVALIEVVLVTGDGPIAFTSNAMLTPGGFQWRRSEERFTVSADQEATLATWWSRLTSGPNAELLRWPVRRFGVSRQRAFDEDRLVDLTIALEGIFMTEADKTSRDSAGDLMSWRANRLLGGDRTATRLRANRVDRGYRGRSDIVHGRLPSEEDTARAVSGLDTVLVEALTALLASEHSVDPTFSNAVTGPL